MDQITEHLVCTQVIGLIYWSKQLHSRWEAETLCSSWLIYTGNAVHINIQITQTQSGGLLSKYFYFT